MCATPEQTSEGQARRVLPKGERTAEAQASGFLTAAASGRRTASIVLRWARRRIRKRSTKSVSREIAVEQILMVFGDVIGQFAHERGMNLFEVAQRFTAVLKYRPRARFATARVRQSGRARCSRLIWAASRASSSCWRWFSRICR